MSKHTLFDQYGWEDEASAVEPQEAHAEDGKADAADAVNAASKVSGDVPLPSLSRRGNTWNESATGAEHSSESRGESRTTGTSSGITRQSSEFNADKAHKALEGVDALMKGVPSTEESLTRGYEPEITALMKEGKSFPEALRMIYTKNDKDAMERSHRLAKAKKTMANLMESFRVINDMSSAFNGGNVYARGGMQRVMEAANQDEAAGEVKYQRALDAFNKRMDALKTGDLDTRRELAMKLLNTGFENVQAHEGQHAQQTESKNVNEGDSRSRSVSSGFAPHYESSRQGDRGSSGNGRGDNSGKFMTLKSPVNDKGELRYGTDIDISLKNWPYVKNGILSLLSEDERVLRQIMRRYKMGSVDEVRQQLLNETKDNKTMRDAVAQLYWYASEASARWVLSNSAIEHGSERRVVSADYPAGRLEYPVEQGGSRQEEGKEIWGTW